MFTNNIIGKVSIALATYNGEKFLAEFLDSVYAQTYQNIEIIVCDDCSTDKTIEILQLYKIKYGLQYFVNEKNLGFVKNFERAISLCSGEFIALADQDDIWFPEKIDTLVNNIGNNLLIHSDAVLVDSENKIIASSFSGFSNKKVQLQAFKQLLFYNNVTGCTVLCKRKLLEYALPFPDKLLYHDWWLAAVAAKFQGIKYLPEKLLYYRQHQNISGGAEVMELDRLISNSIVKGFFNDRYQKNLYLLNWYNAISSLYKYCNNDEKRTIEEMINYHQSFFNRKIRTKAFLLHLKYYKFLYPHYRFYTRILILFTSLIGLGYNREISKYRQTE